MSEFNYKAFERNGKYVYIPKMKEKATFKIKSINIVTDGLEKFHFSTKKQITLDNGKKAEVEESILNENNEAYHIECDLEDGKILSVTSFPAFMEVFKKNNVQPGDTVHVDHLGKGKWDIKVDRGTKTETTEDNL